MSLPSAVGPYAKNLAGAINVLEASRGTIFKPAEFHALCIISIYIGSTHAI